MFTHPSSPWMPICDCMVNDLLPRIYSKYLREANFFSWWVEGWWVFFMDICDASNLSIMVHISDVFDICCRCCGSWSIGKLIFMKCFRIYVAGLCRDLECLASGVSSKYFRRASLRAQALLLSVHIVLYCWWVEPCGKDWCNNFLMGRWSDEQWLCNFFGTNHWCPEHLLPNELLLSSCIHVKEEVIIMYLSGATASQWCLCSTEGLYWSSTTYCFFNTAVTHGNRQPPSEQLLPVLERLRGGECTHSRLFIPSDHSQNYIYPYYAIDI